ncbi:hypothetical protein GCM10023210_10040 [Chryseobacterium ginsengisoli]|uniref:Uncharacterized protein n=1 Tax=Chryseobacterium ginsengisoli TaxID=363853 RepID=A0ABP9M2V0_9FLAO
MKKLILPIALCASAVMYSQVGVNTPDPKATMDITAKTTDGSKPEGLITPRLTGDQIRLGNTSYTTAQTGSILYATSADSAPAGKTINITAPGYYYFDGSVWQKIITGSTGDTTNDAWINDTTNAVVKLGTKADGTARGAYTDVVANDNGALGMGTSTPATRIDIVGDGGVNDDITLNSSGNTSGFAGGITFTRSQGTPVAKTAVTTGNSLGSLSFNGYDGTNNINTAAVSAQINGTVTAGSAPTDLTFSAGTNAATERMRITSAGNVGIGVTTPSNALHVNAANNPVRFEGLVTGAGTSNIVTVDANGVLTKTATTATALAASDTTNDIWINDIGLVKLGTKADGTARGAYTDVVANDNGALGMGTSTPATRIDIVGDGGVNDDVTLNSSGNTSGFAGGITFTRSQGTPVAKTAVTNGNSLGSLSFNGYDGTSNINTAAVSAQINGTVSAGSTPTDLTFSAGTNAATERMRITSAGNVGVGITNPSTKLDINGNLRIGTASPTSGSTNVSTLVRDNTTGEIKVSQSSTGNTANITFVTYTLSNVNKDWVASFNTNIPTNQYTVVVVGNSFNKQSLSNTTGSGTYNPLNVQAMITGSTWSLYADYNGGTTADGSNGTWTINCMIINNSITKTLSGVSADLGGTNTGSASIPSGL